MKLKRRKRWVQKVHTKWHPPQGFFKKSSSSIVKGLLANSKDRNQAIKRLTFYINRSGKNLSKEERVSLFAAKLRLSQ